MTGGGGTPPPLSLCAGGEEEAGELFRGGEGELWGGGELKGTWPCVAFVLGIPWSCGGRGCVTLVVGIPWECPLILKMSSSDRLLAAAHLA